jgi:hypothetical protein
MSDDSAIDKDLQPSAQPPAPEAPAAGTAPAPGAAGEEVEYVYQDENGNPIAAPEGGFSPDEFEVVEVQAPAAAGDASADQELAGATTQRLGKPVSSGRRLSDRKSGRQAKPMTPEELKKVRTRVILVLGLLSLIPILGIALLVTLWWKGHITFGNKKPTTRVVDNDFDKGRTLYLNSSPHLEKANQLYEQGQRAAAYTEYTLCKKDFEEALKMIDNWRKNNPGDYDQVDKLAQDIRIKLHKHVADRLIQLELSGDTGAPKPPAQQPPSPPQ